MSSDGNSTVNPVLTFDLFYRNTPDGFLQRLLATAILSGIGIFCSIAYLIALYVQASRRTKRDSDGSLRNFFWIMKFTKNNLNQALENANGPSTFTTGYILTNTRIVFPLSNILCYTAVIGVSLVQRNLFSSKFDAEGILHVDPDLNRGRVSWYAFTLTSFPVTQWFWVFGLFTNYLWVAGDTSGKLPPVIVNSIFVGGQAFFTIAAITTGVISSRWGLRMVNAWAAVKEGLYAIHKNQAIILSRPTLLLEIQQQSEQVQKYAGLSTKGTATMVFILAICWTVLLLLSIRSLSISYVLGKHIKAKSEMINRDKLSVNGPAPPDRFQVEDKPVGPPVNGSHLTVNNPAVPSIHYPPISINTQLPSVTSHGSTLSPRSAGSGSTPTYGNSPQESPAMKQQRNLVERLKRTRRDFLFIGCTSTISLVFALIAGYGAGVISLRSSVLDIPWGVLELCTMGAIYIYVISTSLATVFILLGVLISSRSKHFTFVESGTQSTSFSASQNKSFSFGQPSPHEKDQTIARKLQRGAGLASADRIDVVYLNDQSAESGSAFENLQDSKGQSFQLDCK